MAKLATDLRYGDPGASPVGTGARNRFWQPGQRPPWRRTCVISGLIGGTSMRS